MTCVTCCIAALPYIGAVILLPVYVFRRSYSIGFLSQFGPDYARFATLGAADGHHVDRRAADISPGQRHRAIDLGLARHDAGKHDAAAGEAGVDRLVRHGYDRPGGTLACEP